MQPSLGTSRSATSSSPRTTPKLRSSVGDLHKEVKSLQSRLFLAKPVALVPGVSGSIRNAEEVLAFADATLQAASNAMDAYLPVVQAMDQGSVDYESLREQIVRERPLFTRPLTPCRGQRLSGAAWTPQSWARRSVRRWTCWTPS
ncbi:MAG: hypothetical protein HY681_14550 [Chloroflexi bacterium]|nr:hypothetical protein [Chloroflexota bacterium]